MPEPTTKRGRNREFYWYDSDDLRVADLMQRWHLSSRSEVLRRCLTLAHAGEVLTDRSLEYQDGDTAQ